MIIKKLNITCGSIEIGLRGISTGGAINALADSRSTSIIDVLPKRVLGCGKYKHCKILLDSKQGPAFLLKSMKKFCNHRE